MVVHHHLLTWCFIFKVSLLLVTVIEASRNIDENNLELNDRVSKIEAKDRHQDGEIALLKNALNEERKLVHDLNNRVKILEDLNKNSGRPKRPVRLLPPHILRGKEKNETDAEDESNFRFYGPATGCNDLGRLGYTLNGFYLVQEKENKSTNSNIGSNKKQIEIVECRFRHNPKLGKQNPDDKEKRLGFIRTTNETNSNTFSRLDIKENIYSKEVDNKERGLRLTRTCDNDANITQSRPNEKGNFNSKTANKIEKVLTQTNNKNSKSDDNIDQTSQDKKGNFNSKKSNDVKKGSKSTNINSSDKNRTSKPRFDVTKNCIFRFKSVIKKLCLVAAEHKSKKNVSTHTTNLPNFYLTQLPCESVNGDEEHWKKKNKHICSIKNEMCLTVSPNIKDGGVLLNLMEYEASAKSQQWTTKVFNSGTGVYEFINIGTPFCLYEPSDGNKKIKATTTIIRCTGQYPNTEHLFYVDQINFGIGPNCIPF